jgi:predicted transcriptional regulator YdeE
LTLDYLSHINQGDISQPQIIERKNTHLAGLMSQGLDNISGLWLNLRQILDTTSSPGKPYTAYGVLTVLQNKDSFYFAGVDVPSPETSNPPLVTLTLPPGPYIQFNHKGGKDTRSLSLDYIYHTWLAKLKTKPSFSRHYFPDSDTTLQTNILTKRLIEVDCFGNQFPIEHEPIKHWVISIPLNL